MRWWIRVLKQKTIASSGGKAACFSEVRMWRNRGKITITWGNSNSTSCHLPQPHRYHTHHNLLIPSSNLYSTTSVLINKNNAPSSISSQSDSNRFKLIRIPSTSSAVHQQMSAQPQQTKRPRGSLTIYCERTSRVIRRSLCCVSCSLHKCCMSTTNTAANPTLTRIFSNGQPVDSRTELKSAVIPSYRTSVFPTLLKRLLTNSRPCIPEEGIV